MCCGTHTSPKRVRFLLFMHVMGSGKCASSHFNINPANCTHTQTPIWTNRMGDYRTLFVVEEVCFLDTHHRLMDEQKRHHCHTANHRPVSTKHGDQPIGRGAHESKPFWGARLCSS